MKKFSGSASQDPPSILLVDDNVHGLVARKTVLKDLGYETSTATSGEEALAMISQRKFDLIITDYKMPQMNGTELIAQVRQSWPAMPIILLSGFVEPLGLTEQSTGADVVLSKSAGEVGHLVRTVSRLLSRQIPRKPAAAQKQLMKKSARSVS